jgi:hypothetical protein
MARFFNGSKYNRKLGVDMLPSNNSFSIINLNEKNEKIVLVNNFPPLLIPTQFYLREYQKEYLAFQFDMEEIGEIFETEIENYIALFFLSKQDYLFVNQQYENVEFQHELLYYYFKVKNLANSKKNSNQLAFIVRDGLVDFWLIKNSDLQLINRLSFTTEFDILYHALNILKQYSIAVEEVLLIMIDINVINKQIPKLLQQYFPHFSVPTF